MRRIRCGSRRRTEAKATGTLAYSRETLGPMLRVKPTRKTDFPRQPPPPSSIQMKTSSQLHMELTERNSTSPKRRISENSRVDAFRDDAPATSPPSGCGNAFCGLLDRLPVLHPNSSARVTCKLSHIRV